MDRLAHYREVIQRLIQEYAAYKPAMGDIQIETIFDLANDHYELIYSGWNGLYRIHGSVLPIAIRDEKVWIQYDGTNASVAEELVTAGIPQEEIVLAYKHPDVRPYTEYAVA